MSLINHITHNTDWIITDTPSEVIFCHITPSGMLRVHLPAEQAKDENRAITALLNDIVEGVSVQDNAPIYERVAILDAWHALNVAIVSYLGQKSHTNMA